jgi:PAS domain S-box-containing protein
MSHVVSDDRFLLDLVDAFGELTDTAAIQATCVRLLAARLQARFVGLYGIDGEGRPTLTAYDSTDNAAPPAPIGRFGEQTVVATEDGIASIEAPVRSGTRAAACLIARRPSPPWTPGEVHLVEQVARRTFIAVERARARANLQLVAERVSEMLESISDAFYAIDGHWRFAYVNKKAEEFWSQRRDELIGTPILEAFSDAVGTDAYRAHVRASIDRQAEHLETMFRGRWVDMSIYPAREGGLAVYFRDVTDRKVAEDRLRESEERLRLVVEGAREFAIQILDTDGRITDWYLGAQAVFGYSREEIIGQDGALLFTPEDREAGEPGKELEIARREGMAPDVRWHLRKNGTLVFIDGGTMPLRRADGTLRGYLKIGLDVTQRRTAEMRLRESEARFRQFAEASSDVIWIRNGETLELEFVGPAFETTYGCETGDVLGPDGFQRWLGLVHADDRTHVIEHIDRVKQGLHDMQEFRICRPVDRDERWIRDTAFPLVDEHGRVHHVAGIGQDVTELRQVQQRQAVLVAELQHRTRNLVAVVRTLMERTLAETGDLDRFAETYRDRLAALARVQQLLSRLNEGDRVAFDQVIRAELRAMGAIDGDGGSPRIALDGPDGVRLRSGTVQTLALALHELATNAVKYGALAQARGRLDVHWRVNGEAATPRLEVTWIESGVAMPEGGAPQGGGYGRELIERALPYQFGALTTYEMGPDGIRCTIDLPLSNEDRFKESSAKPR